MARPNPPTRFDPNRPSLPVVSTEPSPTLDPAAVPVPEAFQLPPHQSKAERIGDHMAALSADLREWTELRIALVQRKVEGVVGIFERIQHLQEAIVPGVVALVLLLVGLLFVLVTAALGLGAWLGHPAWGFLIITSLLLVGSVVFAWMAYRKFRRAEAIVAQAKRERLGVQDATRKEIQDAQAANVRRSAA